MTRSCSRRYSRLVMRGSQHADAFVVQFRNGSNHGAGQLSGRVEHVASGRTATFETIDELPQVLQRMLRSLASDEGIGTE